MGRKPNAVVRGKENLQWTPSMDALFIEAMLYEQNQGNRLDGTFTTNAYKNMVSFLSRKLEIPNLKKEHLKNRLKTLKENFGECYDLFNDKSSLGFVWCSATKMWTAEPEVWKTVLESNPNAARWMTKPIHNYNALKELFAKDKTGEGVGKANRKRKQSAIIKENEVTIDENDNLVFQNLVPSENLVGLDAFEEHSCISKGRAQSHSGLTNANNVDQLSVLAIEKIANTMIECNKQMINAFTKATATLSNAILCSQQRIYTPSEIYNELVQMKLDQPLLDEAYYWLVDNEKMVKLLFGFPPERRKDALSNMMNAAKGCSKGSI